MTENRRKWFKVKVALIGLSLAFCGMRGAMAEDPNAILDLLERKGIITHEEAQEARKYYDKQQADAVVKFDKTKVASWIDEMKWSSDFRLRYEYIDNEDQPGNKNDRTRFRFRLRLGFETKFHDWAKIGVRDTRISAGLMSLVREHRDQLNWCRRRVLGA